MFEQEYGPINKMQSSHYSTDSLYQWRNKQYQMLLFIIDMSIKSKIKGQLVIR